MPELPHFLPKPDALTRGPVVPPRPLVDPFRDPLNPVEIVPPAPLPLAGGLLKEAEKPASGLAGMDATHAFASVLFSGVGRAFFLVLVCMLAFGVTDACFRISLIDDGWRDGGFGGFFGAISACPGALFSAPGRWISALGEGILQPIGVPYLMLVIGGLILAVRSDFDLLKLALFYAVLSAIHAAVFYEMTNPISLLLWLALLGGMGRLYWWMHRRQNPLVEAAPAVEEEELDG